MTDTRAPLQIHIGEDVTEVSEDLWGVFFEDINYSADGGLNADLVQNGDFGYGPDDAADWQTLTAWTAEPASGVEVRSEGPVSDRNPTHVRLAPGARLANHGWDGIRVAAGTGYLARFAARGSGELTVSLCDRETGRSESSAICSTTAEWEWFELRLQPGRDLVANLEFAVDGTVDLDGVSLHPIDPITGEPLIFRPDLLAAVAALNPSFVRFPGGCLVHGVGLSNLYHWKTTIGPRLDRAAMRNLWGYRQSMAIGYFEYFLLCERLGASPMPVVAAGVSCQNTPGGTQCIPDEDMPAYVQDVLDLVEFADGAVDTPWGARRAELGHPEPFGLRYLGVGNEDEITPAFAARYAMIDSAVRDRYPDLSVIGTAGPIPTGADFEAGWALARDLDVDIVDEHMYRSPRWFLQNVDRYDDYPREGPAVYVGEWAARSNRLRSAVAEAAFMIGMERNGDVVRLASYAPLLAKVGHTQWTPDLIYFDDERVLPTVNYHVQAAFAQERILRACELRTSEIRRSTQRPPSMERLSLLVQGDGASLSSVRADGSEVVVPSIENGRSAVLASVPSTTRELRLSLRSADGVVVEFGGPADDSFHELWLGVKPGRAHLWRTDDTIKCHLEGTDLVHLDPESVSEVVIRIDGDRIRCELNGRVLFDIADETGARPDIVVGAGTTETGWSVRVANASGIRRWATVDIEGERGALTGSALTISGDDPDTGEEFVAYPHQPERHAIEGENGTIGFEVPPWSVVLASMTTEVPTRERKANDE